jgi:hypothetical protein
MYERYLYVNSYSSRIQGIRMLILRLDRWKHDCPECQQGDRDPWTEACANVSEARTLQVRRHEPKDVATSLPVTAGRLKVNAILFHI